MSTPITFNGNSYSIPAYGDTGYAQGTGNISSYLIALAATAVFSSGDIPITTAGKGVLITTPDGLHTVRLSVSNLDANGKSTATTEVVT